MSIVVELDLPEDPHRFHLPAAVDKRLQWLLDRQDQGIPLTDEERAEAEGIVEVAETMALLRLRSQRLMPGDEES